MHTREFSARRAVRGSEHEIVTEVKVTDTGERRAKPFRTLRVTGLLVRRVGNRGIHDQRHRRSSVVVAECTFDSSCAFIRRLASFAA
jgi:hypothetical protein